jgi:IS30 family transposase
VAQKLALQWSPEQISGWLKQKFPTHQDMQISQEAIYRSLFIRTRGVIEQPGSWMRFFGSGDPQESTTRKHCRHKRCWDHGRTWGVHLGVQRPELARVRQLIRKLADR